MKLRQLQCLCAIVDAGFNISRAATTLHATQPAVGKQLRQLEAELGVDLLLRQGGRPVGLTPAGERIIHWGRRALQCADNIRAAARENSGGEQVGDIALAASHTTANYVLVPAIVSFTSAFPRVRIHVQQGTTGQVVQMVSDGKVAVGITLVPPQIPREIVAIPFQAMRQVAVVPAGHPLLRVKELTLEKLAAYPIVTQSRSRPIGARIVRTFEEAGLEVDLRVEALDSDVMKTYVAAGLGIAIIPAIAYSRQTDRGLRALDVHHLFEPTVSAVLLKRDSHLPRYVYTFLEKLDATLEKHRVEELIFEKA
jgi:DNA-binding transcriptional LysR family regulator